MAQEYYSFMMNRFFETLFIQLMANIYDINISVCPENLQSINNYGHSIQARKLLGRDSQ